MWCRGIEKMQERLRTALANQAVKQLAYKDLTYVLRNLGMNTRAIIYTTNLILETLARNDDLEMAEAWINARLQCSFAGGRSIIDILDDKMADRARIIYGQVSLLFEPNESIIDWGCGDGQVTNLIYDHITRNIEGWDVRHYPASGISVPIKQFDGERVTVSNGFFDAGLMTNVAHHEAYNAKILRELSRIIRPKGRLVVIETVPTTNDPEEFERTFIGDYVYNRLFHTADIPVPGTYESEEGWVRRFAEVGFELEDLGKTANPTPLGYDQPTIRDWHTRLVLRRVG